MALTLDEMLQVPKQGKSLSLEDMLGMQAPSSPEFQLDDTPALSAPIPESELKVASEPLTPDEYQGSLGYRAMKTFKTGAEGLWLGLVARLQDFTGVSLPGLEGATADEVNREFSRNMGYLDAGDIGFLDKPIRSATDFVLNSIPAVGVAGPRLAAKFLLSQYALDAGNKTYTDALDAGLSPEKAGVRSVLAMGIEAGGTIMGGRLAAKLGGKSFEEMFGPQKQSLMQAVLGLGAELTEENGINIANSLTDAAMGVRELDPKQMFSEFVNTSLATVLGMGASYGAQRALDFIASPSRANAKKAGLPPEEAKKKSWRDKIALEAGEIMTGRQFKDRISEVATSPQEAEALVALVEARAEAAGESFEDYVGSRFAGVEKGRWKPSNAKDVLEQAAYHGSPHEFSEFSTQKIGAGEGNQAYGWGLYFASNDKVARWYRAKLTGNNIWKADDSRVNRFLPQDPRLSRTEVIEKTAQALRDKGREVRERTGRRGTDAEYNLAAWRLEHGEVTLVPPDLGRLYEVDLKPKDHDWLDWDKPLAEQPKQMQDRVRKIWEDLGQDTRDAYLDELNADLDELTGKEIHRVFYKAILDGEVGLPRDSDAGRAVDEEANILKGTSLFLESAGIRGIKYLDGLSRAKDSGTYNFVLFNDSDVKVNRVLAQRRKGQTVQGHVQFVRDGRDIIRAFESQDVTTLAHELGHVFRRDLADSDLAVAEKWAGVKKGDWTVVAEEKFARAFETYLAEGKAPTPRLQKVFERFKSWLTNVYAKIKGSPLENTLSPEIRAVFDGMLTPQQTQQELPGPVYTRNAEQEAANPQNELLQRFRGLANHALDPEARTANYEADRALGFPENKSRDEANQQAAANIAENPEAVLQKWIGRIDAVEGTDETVRVKDMTETAELAFLKEAIGADGYRNNDPQARELHRKLNAAFRAARSEDARKLGYRDPFTKDAKSHKQHIIIEAMSTVDEDTYQRVAAELEAGGIDLTNLDAIMDDPAVAATVLEKFRPREHSFSDKMFEFWRNMILSGPATHAVNMASNTAFAAYHLGVERPTEAIINLFVRDPKGAKLGEFGVAIEAAIPAVRRGLHNARVAWQTERSALSDELGRDEAFKVEGPRTAIQGKFGRLVRSPGFRPLLSADEGAKTITSAFEAAAHAYRIATEEGLRGEERKSRVAELVDDYRSAAWDAGLSKAEEMAFQGNKGLAAKALVFGIDVLRKIPGVRYIIPFRDTPAAIFEEGLKRTPVLGAILDVAEARWGDNNLADAGWTPTLARQTIGIIGALMLWDIVDDEDPWITGTEALKVKGDREQSYRTIPPQSVVLFGKAISYARMEPFATALAWTVDTVRGLKQGRPASAFLSSTLQQLDTKSYLDGLGDFVDAVQSGLRDDWGKAAEWSGKFAASWVPNLYRQTMRAAEGELPETRVWGTDWDKFKRIMTRSAQQTKIPGIESTPRFDLWGRRIRYNDSLGGPKTDFVFSLLSPVKVKDLDNVTRLDWALLRYNMRNPDEKIVWNEPQKFVRVKGKNVYLSDEQYAEYAQLAGQLALEYASRVKIDPENPTKAKMIAIKELVAEARRVARYRLIPKWGLKSQ